MSRPLTHDEYLHLVGLYTLAQQGVRAADEAQAAGARILAAAVDPSDSKTAPQTAEQIAHDIIGDGLYGYTLSLDELLRRFGVEHDPPAEPEPERDERDEVLDIILTMATDLEPIKSGMVSPLNRLAGIASEVEQYRERKGGRDALQS